MNFTRAVLVIGAALACFVQVAGAALFSWTSGLPDNGVVPDGAPTGWSDTRTVTGLGGEITDVDVHLNLSAGYNGDLYVYLAHNGETAVLLNRVGRTAGNSFGYGDAGLDVRLNDQADQTVDIHFYRTVSGYSVTTGTEWRPDARLVDPATITGTENQTHGLARFNGLIGNGDWTLFVSDMSSGASTKVNGWELDISAVPEPAGMALGIFGAVLAAGFAWRQYWRRRTAV